MATSVSICTAALLMLGDSPIASLNEGTKAATRCAALYPLARREVLRAHPWNCAIKRVSLPALTAAPAWGWQYQFAMPGDLLRLLQVGETGQTLPYEYEGGRVLANVTPLAVRYVSDIDESLWDDALVDAMTWRMAMALAYPTTASAAVADRMAQEYARRLQRAKSIDGQENPPEDMGDDSPFLQVRG